MREQKGKCDYPDCKATAMYAPFKKTKDEWFHLCERWMD